MSKVGSWSTTPGSNNATPPDGWPEGQAPSTINDCAREMMASIRTYIADAQYVDLNNTPSFLTATTFSLGTADATNFHVGRRVKLYDGSTLYGTIDSVSSTFVSVRLDGGALTASLSSVALAAVSEANSSLPPSVWTGRNVIINGNMEIWQRGASFSTTSGAVQFAADRFAMLHTSSAAVNMKRAERSASTANVPTIAQAGQHLNSSLHVLVSAADAAIAAGDFCNLLYKVEGHDWRQIAHKPNILTFWASTNRSGVYHCALRNHPASASFVQAFTVSSVNTWTHVAITVPEAPTTVTWNYSRSAGLVVGITLAAGSTYQAGAAGNWTAGEYIATNAQTNFLASAGNVFMVTGMSLREGTQIRPLEVRPHAAELALCQRYYWRGQPCGALNFGAYTAGAIMSWPVRYPVTMRATATMSVVAPGINLVALQTAPTATSATEDGFRLMVTASAASTNANFSFISTDYIEADAEL